MKKLNSILLILLMFPLLLQAQYPSLDPDFNEYNYDDALIVMAVQPDEKILILERGKISRLEGDGSKDTSFGVEGTVSEIDIDPFSPYYYIPSVETRENLLEGNLFIQEDQKIIIASSSKLLRLNPDGSMDNTFGENGYVNYEVPLDYSETHTHEDLPITPFAFADLEFQSDGKILVAGTSTIPTDEPVPPFVAFTPWDTFSLFRFNTDGSPDETFGDNGHMLIPIQLPSGTQISGYITDIEVQHDDKILLGGRGVQWSSDGFEDHLSNYHAIVRLHPDGELDQNFNLAETLLLKFHEDYIESIAIQEDQKILITSSNYSEFALQKRPTEIVRLNHDGSLDQTFAQNGVLSLPLIHNYVQYGEMLKVLPNGEILFINLNRNPRVFLVKTDGSIDPNFGEDGSFIIPDIIHSQTSIVFQNNKLIVAESQSRLIKRYILYEPEPALIAVQKLTLINAETDEELYELEDGAVINLQEIGTDEINIRTYSDPEPTGSVKFTLTGAQSYSNIENNPYYALYQNSGEDFFSWKPDLGEYQLTVTPFSEAGAQGDDGIPLTVNFTVIDEEVTELAVTKFTLINAQTDQEMFELEDGQVINLQEIGTNEINIRAYSDPEPTGSVKFNLRGVQSYDHIENNAYYALFLNAGEDFFSWIPELGEYHLTATPFSESGATGETGNSLTVSFTIIDEELPDLKVEKFTLINAETDEELYELTNGHIIDLQEIGTDKINIRAYTNPEPTGSVAFSLSGIQAYEHVENNAYYALFLNAGEDFFGWTPVLGDYQLIATPYSEASAKGETGTALTIEFSVVNTSEENFRTINAYPNPGTDLVNIPVSLSGTSTIMILDLNGKEVKTKNTDNHEGIDFIPLDVSDLAKKTYIIKIVGTDEVKTFRWRKH